MKIKWLAVSFLGILFISCLWITKIIWEKCSPKPEHFAYYVPASINFTSTELPYLDIEIGDKKLTAELDIGFYGDIKVTSEFLKEIADKSFISTESSYGWKGKKYRDNIYEIPAVKIGKLSIHPVCLHEEDPAFLEDAKIAQKNNDLSIKYFGRLGWKIFKNTKLFLDLGNSRIIICDSIETLKNHGHCMDTFVKAPLVLDHDLLQIDTMTPNGPLRCLLDTGTTLNILQTDNHADIPMEELLLNPSYFMKIPVFQIAERDFGITGFHCLPVRLPFKIDAILGMEFFFEHQVFIDFANKQVYFAKTKKNSPQKS